MASRDIARHLPSQYSVERELDGGGMSRVFVAFDETLARRAVIKVLRPDLAAAVNVERFRREIRVVANLVHPHIVPLLSAGEVAGLPYYTMPFIEGESLGARLRRDGCLPIAEATRYAREIAEVLEYAHRRRIVHRDIKPGNILIHEGHALVMDFGIARAVTESANEERLTQAGVVIGTPKYMSPEQAAGDPALDGRADVYSLGCVLFELLTGRPPYIGDNPQAIVAQHFAAPVPSARAFRHDVPVQIDDAIASALAKKPAARCPSAAQFAAALVDTTYVSSGVRWDVAPTKPMIAVLPFTSLSANSDDEYFSDGITEDIITQLSKIGALRVISRTSAMRFKGTHQSLREIAAALQATHIVEGSVRRAGQRLRIVAQLIEASTDTHLWGQTYDRELSDIFAIQSEVAEAIAGALRATLAPAEQQRLSRKPTDDQAAYDLFLLARHHLNTSTAEGFSRAMELYRQAVERDPDFARAWGALARAHHFHLAGYYGVAPREVAKKVVEYAERALQLDPDLAEAHMMLGYVDEFITHDPARAWAHKERALHLSPNMADAHLALGNSLIVAGKYRQALEEGRIALELDPASELVHLHVNWQRMLTRDLDAAIAGCEAAEAQFGMKLIPLVHGEALLAAGRATEGLAVIRALYDQVPSTLNLAALGWFLAAAGRDAAARAVLEQLEKRGRREYVWPLPVALAHAYLGDMDTAFRALNQALDDGASWAHMPYAPTFDPFRSDPRFEGYVQRTSASPPSDS
ncbi:MAG TPA: protein kinase [Gemmatimonadaceae bacterium]